MKHASCSELKAISDLITRIRAFEGIREKSPCHFYYRNRNVLHFHTDSGLLYADLGERRISLGETVNPDKTKVDLVLSVLVHILSADKSKKVFER